MTRNPAFTIDGQPKKPAPMGKLDLLDGVGIDLRLIEQPVVFEHSNFNAYIAFGGDWPATVPMDLE